MSHADIVNAWFNEKIATGPIARDTSAYNQAFAAKADLIARLDAASAPPEPALAPAEPPAEAAPEPQPEPAAEAASEKE